MKQIHATNHTSVSIRRWCRGAIRLAVAAFLVSVALGTAVHARDTSTLTQLWKGATQSRRYVAATQDECHQAEQLFLRTLSGREPFRDLQTAWADLHFELLRHRIEKEELWVLQEESGHIRGRGFYVLRPQASLPIALQAPHSFYDEHTQVIAARLFREADITAAAWNTVHRSTVDLAHTQGHYLNALTRAFVAARPSGVIVQLHGFVPKKRKTTAAASADLILSNGTKYPQPWIIEAASLFQDNVGHGVARLYPRDVLELGGTTNTQGAIIRAAERGRFIHLEMSQALRRKLRYERLVRKDFLTDLTAAYKASGR
jgi:hypothetical protein